jgi:hypothetical protein
MRRFPLRELDNRPDQPQPGSNSLPSRLPILHVCKNLLLTKIGHWLRMRPLLRRNSLVLFDGHDYERLLDRGAVKDFESARLLVRPLSFYPRTDLVVVLKAPAAPAHSRNQALSEEEALRQSVVVEQLRLDPQRILQVDAASPPRWRSPAGYCKGSPSSLPEASARRPGEPARRHAAGNQTALPRPQRGALHDDSRTHRMPDDAPHTASRSAARRKTKRLFKPSWKRWCFTSRNSGGGKIVVVSRTSYP